MIRNIQGLDHLVINVGEALTPVGALYRKLGFTLTPRGVHSMGTINHLMIFRDTYMELLGAPVGFDSMGISQLLRLPRGLVACALTTRDARAAYREFANAGIAATEPEEFTRPVDLPEGSRLASFCVTRLEPELTKGMAFFLCQHYTPELVWRSEWQNHANGVHSILALTIVVDEPATALEPYRDLFGMDRVSLHGASAVARIGQVSTHLVTLTDFVGRYGVASLGEATSDYMAGVTLAVESIDATERYFSAAGVAFSVDGDRVIVPAREAGGVILEFRSG